MLSLVGYTGFVGSNIAAKGSFDGLYNSHNIQTADGTNPELLVYAGVRAEKFLANKDPQADFAVVQEAIENIKRINPQKLVLISTIDVYKNPLNVDEDTVIDASAMQAYGLNRYYLEQWVMDHIKNHLIVRLPGLYGINLKKNFIFDMINLIPFMLNKDKYQELSAKSALISQQYQLQANGFYQCVAVNKETRGLLKEAFADIGFSALNFTDSRGVFQFYPLASLWGHIQIALEYKWTKLNLATPPIEIAELYRYIYGCEFQNHIAANPPYYDYKTKHYRAFNGDDGYIFEKSFLQQDIKRFVEAY